MAEKDNTSIIVIIIVLLALFLFGGFGFGMIGFNNYGYRMGSMMNWIFPSYGFMWLFGWLFMILIIVALILFIIWLVKQIQKPQMQKTTSITRRRK